jgi:predicted Fe-Mo cluster-binding NifX family protein
MGKDMKIALPVDGDNLEGLIAGSFGRTKKFIIVDEDTLEYEIKDNTQNLQAAQGAGIQSAQNITETGAEAVISLHLGPKAHRVLKGSGIKIYTAQKGTIKENIDALKAGKLTEMESANMESHWV